MPRKKAAVPANETTDQKFARVATERVNRLLTGLKQLGSLGGPGYTSKAEQRKQIHDALTNGVTKAMEAMAKDGTAQPEFKLR